MSLRRVLIIDDDDDVQAVVCGCLEDIAGWEVISASSGAEGLEKVQSDRPDAIVLDLMMPGMNGIEVLRHLRADPITHTIPVVLLTAKAELIDSPLVSALGIAGAIAKPFNPISLSQQIAALLGWDS